MLLKGEAFYFRSDIAMVPEILLLLFSNLHFVKNICVWHFHILKTFFPVVFLVKLKLEFRSEEGMECVISHLAEITMTLFSMPVLFLVVKKRTGIFIFSCIFHQIWKKKKTSQELRMLSSVTINCRVTKIVICHKSLWSLWSNFIKITSL